MNLIKFRNSLGYTQDYVAKQMNVSRQTIINWEKEHTEIKAKEAAKIAKLYGTTVEKLVED